MSLLLVGLILVLSSRGRPAHIAAWSPTLAVRLMLELEIVLRHEAKVIWAHVFEGTNPAILLRESTDYLTGLHLEVPLGVQRIKVADHFVDLEVLRLFELFQVSLSDLDVRCERLRQWQPILAITVRSHRVVQVSVAQDSVRVNAEVFAVPSCRSLVFHSM